MKKLLMSLILTFSISTMPAQAGLMTFGGPVGWFMAGSMLPTLFAPVGGAFSSMLPWYLGKEAQVKKSSFDFKNDLKQKISEGVYTRLEANLIWKDLAPVLENNTAFGITPAQMQSASSIEELIEIIQGQVDLKSETVLYLFSISGIN